MKTFSFRKAFLGILFLSLQIAGSASAQTGADSSKKESSLGEVVVSGTLREVRRSESPVAVEVYSASFLRKNPTPSLFEAIQQINGVRPQINCNLCNTGDIHINGLEGPYTMVLIDGMPIVSGLGTVYGLSGIPTSLIDRVEVIKGPASTLYGSEAVGGLINVITKSVAAAPRLSAEIMTTSWGETTADFAFKKRFSDKVEGLTALHTFRYQTPKDANGDGFTDVTLQQRFSVFQKLNFKRKEGRIFTLAGRYFYEDRWGGDMRWNTAFRGTDSIYGESIYTHRAELLGRYQLPFREKLMLSFSANHHNQDSRYGTTVYDARQTNAFAQLTWEGTVGKTALLAGAATRYTYYQDNTPATATAPDKIWLPGVFVQSEWKPAAKHVLLTGLRYDYNSRHGNIFTPRVAYKWSPTDNASLRLNLGTGFRVVNLFTEDHAALTGARTVIIREALRPEQSYNANLNYLQKLFPAAGGFVQLDASVFYTHFRNRILPDYLTDPSKIIYANLEGYAESKGVTLNAEYNHPHGLRINAGATLMDNSVTENGVRRRPLLTERFTAVWTVSYAFFKGRLTADYTGNLYSPMLLPTLGPTDPRLPESPWWSRQNIQLTLKVRNDISVFGGVKNIFSQTPDGNGNPFLIARTTDPFNKAVRYKPDGAVQQTSDNPYGLTFDPGYVYAPMQPRTAFVGMRYQVGNRK